MMDFTTTFFIIDFTTTLFIIIVIILLAWLITYEDEGDINDI